MTRRWAGMLGIAGVLLVLLGILYAMVFGFSGSFAVRADAADVAAMYLTGVGLVVSVVGAVIAAVQLRVSRRPVPVSVESATTTAVQVGLHSLLPPDGLLGGRVHGRSELVDELALLVRSAKRPQRVHVLTGMGGVGKSTVALAVAPAATARGVEVWWISATSLTDLHLGMRHLAVHLGADAQKIEQEWSLSAPDLIWRMLQAFPRPWLLILDEADDPRWLTMGSEPVASKRGWVRPPESRHGTVLVTSRIGDLELWGEWCRLHPVEMLTSADGAQLLLDHVGPIAGRLEQAEELSRRLGGLPLGLKLAGRYLADTTRVPLGDEPVTFDEYRAALDSDGGGKQLRPPEPLNESPTMGRPWELSLRLLEERGLGLAGELLQLLSSFENAPIPFSLLLDPKTMADLNPFQQLDFAVLRRLLRALETLGLIGFEHDRNVSELSANAVKSSMLIVHPVVRDGSRRRMQEQGGSASILTVAVALLEKAIGGEDQSSVYEPRLRRAWQTIAPHALRVFFDNANADDTDRSTVGTAATIATNVAEYLASMGLYASARSTAQAVMDACISRLGPHSSHALRARTLLAELTYAAGNRSASVQMYREVIADLNLHLGESHPETLIAAARYEAIQGEMGEPQHARDQLALLIPRLEQHLGPQHVVTLEARNDHALYTGHAGDVVTARELFRQICADAEPKLGPDHDYVLSARSNLASYTGIAGDHDEALQQFAVLLFVYELMFGPDHPATLLIRANLAHWTGIAGDPHSAHEQYQAVHRAREQVLGADHPDTLIARIYVHHWDGMSGNHQSARLGLTALIPQLGQILGSENPHTLTAHLHLARWIFENGAVEEAFQRVASLIPNLVGRFGRKHPDSAAAIDLHRRCIEVLEEPCPLTQPTGHDRRQHGADHQPQVGAGVRSGMIGTCHCLLIPRFATSTRR